MAGGLDYADLHGVLSAVLRREHEQPEGYYDGRRLYALVSIHREISETTSETNLEDSSVVRSRHRRCDGYSYRWFVIDPLYIPFLRAWNVGSDWLEKNDRLHALQRKSLAQLEIRTA